MKANVNIEAYGFGVCLRTCLLQGESPETAADRLVLAEDRRRKTLQNKWQRLRAGDLESSPKNRNNESDTDFTPKNQNSLIVAR